MIELIFVIVIIGILAAVALPKLTATRDDAVISTIVSNVRVALSDFEAYYISQNNTIWNTATVHNVTNALLLTSCNAPVDDNTSISPNTFVLCHDDVICLSFKTTAEGHLTIIDGTVETDRICEAVKADPAIRNLSNKTYVLGGQSTVR